MRKTISGLLYLTVVCFACNKADDEQQRSRITPALLRAPTCGDTTDDGVFEAWNSTEDSLMFPGPTHYTMPATPGLQGYLRSMALHSRRISAGDGVFTIHAAYDTGVMWNTQFFLVNNSTGRTEGWAYASRPSRPQSDHETDTLTLSGGAGLTPGCRRLYYFGSRVILPAHSGALVVPDSMIVLFKGHFDVEVY